DASRPAAEGRGPPDRGPRSPWRAPRGPGPGRGRTRLDRPRDHDAAGGVDGYRATPGVSGTTYHGSTGLSLDQASRRPQSSVAGDTGTARGLGHAHRRGVPGVCAAPTAGPPLAP